jgi:hypothetical protein
MLKKILLLALGVLIQTMFLIAVQAQPVAVDGIDQSTPERKPSDSGGTAIQSEDGNTSELNINATRITQHWQGYYGNISGEITLDDADSNSLYSWSLTSVSGEIFAVNTSATVQWSNITCVNISSEGNLSDIATSNGVNGLNLTVLNQHYLMANQDKDSFNETFTSTYGGGLSIGGVTLAASDNCPMTFPHVNNISDSTNFREILLFDNESALVYTAVINDSAPTGFDANTWNFEMLVGQQNSTIGTYYFYVELS